MILKITFGDWTRMNKTKKVHYEWFIVNTDNDRSGRDDVTFEVKHDEKEDVLLGMALLRAQERVMELENAKPANIKIGIFSIDDAND